MKQRSLNHTYPVVIFITAVMILGLASKGGWLSSSDWEPTTIVCIVGLAIFISLFFEPYITGHRLLLIVPYTLVAVGELWAIYAHLASVRTTFNIIVVVIGLLGALPGGIAYILLTNIFQKQAAERFENANPEVTYKRESVLGRMSMEDKQAMFNLYQALEKIASSDRDQPQAVEAIARFVEANCNSREQAISFMEMYEAVVKRELVPDLVSGAGRKNGGIVLGKFINYGIIDPVAPFKRTA